LPPLSHYRKLGRFFDGRDRKRAAQFASCWQSSKRGKTPALRKTEAFSLRGLIFRLRPFSQHHAGHDVAYRYDHNHNQTYLQLVLTQVR
jgi:hypothetical protein